MKVIILSPTKQIKGGVERFSLSLLDSLVERGLNTSIVSIEDLSSFEVLLIKLVEPVGLGQVLLGFFLGQKAKSFGYDICITNGLLGWSLNTGKLVNVQHGTFVLGALRTKKDDSFIKFFIKYYVWGYFEGITARNSSICVAVAEEVKQTVLKYYRPKKVVVIPNAIDTELFKPQDGFLIRDKYNLSHNKKVLYFAGRLSQAKGGGLINEIASYIKEHNLDIVIACAVYGELVNNNLGIVMLPYIPYENLNEVYNMADIFLLPSKHEGSSLALLEAMSSGVPFLASPVGLVPEFIEQGLFTECIVAELNSAEYIRKMHKLLSMKDVKKKQISKELREYVLSKHTLRQFGANYFSLIKSL